MNTNRCCHFVLYLEYKKIIFFLSPLFVGSMYVFILTWGQMDFRRILVFASLTVHSLNFEKSWGISKSPLGEAHRWYVWHGIILWYSYIYIGLYLILRQKHKLGGRKTLTEKGRFNRWKHHFSCWERLSSMEFTPQNWTPQDGLLVDLGVSSPQLDDRHRGFGVNEALETGRSILVNHQPVGLARYVSSFKSFFTCFYCNLPRQTCIKCWEPTMAGLWLGPADESTGGYSCMAMVARVHQGGQ